MFRFSILGSGSSGNALLLETQTTRVLVDCGFSATELARRMQRAGLGIAPDGLDAVVVTHCHGDHAMGASALSHKFKLPLYVAPGTKRWLGTRRRFDTVDFTPGGAFTIGDLSFQTIGLSHDAPDTVALRVEHALGAFGLCTDLGEVTPNVEAGLSGCRTIMLESNHDVEMVEKGPYPARLKKRILGRWGHISNEQCRGLLDRLVPAGAHHVILSHLSETNNTPALAMKAMEPLRAKHPHVRWSIAPHDVPAVFNDDPEQNGAVLHAARQMELL